MNDRSSVDALSNGVRGTYLGCGVGPDLGTASDVQRVIELLVHLVRTQQHQGAASPSSLQHRSSGLQTLSPKEASHPRNL